MRVTLDLQDLDHADEAMAVARQFVDRPRHTAWRGVDAGRDYAVSGLRFRAWWTTTGNVVVREDGPAGLIRAPGR